MGQKKDIGQLFENKLGTGKKTPNTSLWKKINISLDEESRRRKRKFIYWLVGGGFSVLLGLFLLFGNGNFLKPNYPSQKTTLNGPSDSTLKKESDKVPETLSKTSFPKENSELKSAENWPMPNTVHKSEKVSPKSKNVGETFTVTEKYYYYNSRDGKQIVTQNKNKIDSLIEINNKFEDTFFLKTKDSLR